MSSENVSRIGRYQILRQLGRGAMGVVYLARDPQIERDVALKTVRFDATSPSFSVVEAKARFLKEAKISGRLQHPHIVTVFDVGEDEGTLYLAMEFISGGSFSQCLSDPEPLPVGERIRIVAEVAEALGHAHDRNVLHRDVKPANILLTENLSAKVTDFGIGKLLTGDSELTSTGQMVGSPSYMSPEQIKGEKLDVRTDIFSLGVVLYQALTNRKPFPADTLTTLVYQILHDEPQDPLLIQGDLPAEVTNVIRRCLAKNRADRYANADELAVDLRSIIGFSPVSSTASLSESKIRRARAAMSGIAAPVLPNVPTTALPFGPPPPVRPASDMDGPTIMASSDGLRVPPSPPIPPAALSQAPTEAPRPSGPPAAPPAAVAKPRPAGQTKKVLAMAAAFVALLVLGLMGGRILRTATVPKGAEDGAATPVPTSAAVPSPSPVPAVVAGGEATPSATPAVTATPAAQPTEAIRVVETPLATPPPSPTRRPRVRPTATPFAVTVPPTVTPIPRPADLSFVVRRFVKVNVRPDQARVFLDGKYIGISDDWDASGGGALLAFNLEGRHRLRLAYPGYKDLVVDVRVSINAVDDKIEIDRPLEKGAPDGWTGPDGKFKRPNYRTVGPVRFQVQPAETLVAVNGKTLGPASSWVDKDLLFENMAVYDVQLSAPEHETKDLRIIVAPSTEEARAVVKEKLKKVR